jgi:D-alanyl-D-alanine carboxypeptidase
MQNRNLVSGLIVLAVVLAGALTFGGYRYYVLSKDFEKSQTDHVKEISELQEKLDSLEGRLAESEDNLAKEQERNENILSALRSEENRNEAFQNQIEEIAGTVGVLDKLSKTDKELLQKYSKVYFLNEHYVPEALTSIPLKYLYYEDRPQQIHQKVLPYLEDMAEDADGEGIKLYITSAYRSFGTQAALKSGYTVTYGAGTANQFSADQGYSEHQLGTTADFTTVGINGGLDGFDKTPAYQWLLDNAHRYGFVLSYPENNSYYEFEPWHWRFVGSELANDLHKKEVGFYDLPQREIDQYLVSIFD